MKILLLSRDGNQSEILPSLNVLGMLLTRQILKIYALMAIALSLATAIIIY